MLSPVVRRPIDEARRMDCSEGGGCPATEAACDASTSGLDEPRAGLMVALRAGNALPSGVHAAAFCAPASAVLVRDQPVQLCIMLAVYLAAAGVRVVPRDDLPSSLPERHGRGPARHHRLDLAVVEDHRVRLVA